jgi:molybdenum cofactor cytidylyltransferase/nicotine blue oxidoreductase
MGRPKAEVVFEGRTLVERAVGVADAAGCAPVYVVVRAGADVPQPAIAVANPDPDRGLRSSLAVAVDAAAGVDALAVLLVDMPGMSPAAVRAACAAWSPGRIAVARFGTGRGHPIVMAPHLWSRALDLAGPDEGARQFLAAHPELVDEVPVDGDPFDLDTPEDLARRNP